MDNTFKAHWSQLSTTRFFRGAYHFLKPLQVPPGAGPVDMFNAADQQAQAFLRAFKVGGGWRQYDLPPMIDFEYEFVHDHDAWTMLPALVAMIAAMQGAFGLAPLFYTYSPYMKKWYDAAKRAYALEYPTSTWDDDALSPIFDRPAWPAAYSPSRSPDDEPLHWPPPQPAGYSGSQWFSGGWSIWQWGVAKGSSSGPATPLAATTGHALGAAGDLDQDVWNGDIDSLTALALRTKWNL